MFPGVCVLKGFGGGGFHVQLQARAFLNSHFQWQSCGLWGPFSVSNSIQFPWILLTDNQQSCCLFRNSPGREAGGITLRLWQCTSSISGPPCRSLVFGTRKYFSLFNACDCGGRESLEARAPFPVSISSFSGHIWKET